MLEALQTSPEALTPTSSGPPHDFLIYVGDELRVCPSPAPDYRAADKFEYSAVMAAPQVRPLAITDMIPFVPYLPGSIVWSRFYGSLPLMVRIVACLDSTARSDARASLVALLDREDAGGRPALRQMLTKIIRDLAAAPKDWSLTPAEIEQSRITTLIL